MPKLMSCRILFVLATLLVLAGCGSGDSKTIAESLADKLTDALAIDGSNKADGPPPGSSSTPLAPVISATEGTELRLGAPFAFTLTSAYTSEDVDHAIVYVSGANRYFTVPGLIAGGSFAIAGTLGTDDLLRGKSFDFQFALVTKAGVIGPYTSFGRQISDAIPETGKTITAITSDGESSHDSGRPAGSTDAAAPQIISLAGQSELAAGGSFTISISTRFGATVRKAAASSIDSVILTTPANTAYKEIPASAANGLVTLHASLASDLAVGDRLIFMLALKAGTLVGAYRPYLVRVVAMPTDGDAESENEAEPELELEPEQEAEPEPEIEVEVEPELEYETDLEPEPELEAETEAETPSPTFVSITAGTFVMGSPDGVNCPPDVPSCNIAQYPAELGHSSNETQHSVTLTYNFEMSVYETTQEQFSGLMGYNPSTFSTCGTSCPVEQVDWHEACAYANALSVQKGYAQCFDCTGSGTSVSCSLKTAYAKPQDCPGFRLPTEAEWEYAARAGTTTATYNGNLTVPDCTSDPVLAPIAWYCFNAGSTTHPVGLKTPNAWGLYDMSGNVYEWGWDWWDGSDLGSDSVTDPTGLSTGSYRVDRGGSWGNRTPFACSADRGGNGAPDFRNAYIGFRLVRTTGKVVPKPIFVPITAGTFIMGSPDGVNCPPDVPGCTIASYPAELGRDTYERQHEVTLTINFEMSRYEITQAEFTGLMGWNPSYFGPNGAGAACGDNCPVENIAWNDAVAYANELSLIAGLTPCYLFSNVICVDTTNVAANYMTCMGVAQGGINSATVELNGVTKPQDCTGYRLPTEAEGEYAARADSRTAFYPSTGNDGSITASGGGDPNMDKIGWYTTNAVSTTHPVGEKAANAWGLYDMSGNVNEWGWDWWDLTAANSSVSVTDPTGLVLGTNRVYRGGVWNNGARLGRSAFRGNRDPSARDYGLGIRLVRSRP